MKDEEFTELKKELYKLDPEERVYAQCEHSIETKLKDKKFHCHTCWFIEAACICSKIKKIQFSRKIKFLIFMHWKEYFRASNTAKVLLIAAPNSSKLYLFGRKKEEQELIHEMSKDPQHTFLLFPAEDFVTTQQFLHKMELEQKQEKFENFPTEEPTITVVVIDGTWGNAATIMRFLNKATKDKKIFLQKLKLEPTTLSSFTRTQSSPDRICTIESIVLLLKELGESEELQASLLNGFDINIEATRVNEWKPSKPIAQPINCFYFCKTQT